MASMRKGKRAGGKFTGSHTTVAKGVEHIIDYIEAMPRVTKISLGRITNGGRSPEAIPTVTCVFDTRINILAHVAICKGSMMQEFFVWLTHPKTRRCFRRVLKWLERREQRGR